MLATLAAGVAGLACGNGNGGVGGSDASPGGSVGTGGALVGVGGGGSGPGGTGGIPGSPGATGGASGAAGTGGASGQTQAFTHPGIPLTLADLNQLKANLGTEPWRTAYSALTADSHSQLSYAMRGPFAMVSRTPDVNLAQYRDDMQAVFNLARIWFFTGTDAYARKARDIMIAWATTHTTWGGAESYLTMGDYAYRMYGGADILRGTWPGWTQADTDLCKRYFNDVYWWAGTVPNPLRSANQGVEQLITAVGVAAFNDDREKFAQALQAFRADAVGGLANSMPSGVVGDSGRDQGHAFGQLMHLAWIAEVFWKQGVDVFAELDNRLLAAGEFFSRYNLGVATPFIQFGTMYDIYPTHGAAPNSSPQPPDFLNLVHGAYVLRKGLSAPYVSRYRAVRPETSDSFVFRKSQDSSTAAAPAPLASPATPASVTTLSGADIGGASPTGSSSYAGGTWTLRGGGTDVGGASDSFRFAYLPVTGDGSVIARVTSVQNTAGDAKAGVMIREALTPTAPMMGVYMLPQTTVNGNTGPRAFANMRGQVASSHGATSQTHRLWDATTVSIPYWLRVERIGNRITAYHSTDGASWSTIHCADFAMGAPAYMGLVVASRVNGTLNSATFTDVRITGADGGESARLPAAPFAVYGSPGNGEVPLRWLESLGATAYRLKRSTSSGGPYSTIATLSGTSYVDRSVTNGVTYYYVVGARNAVGESGDSLEETVVPTGP